jgi:hypothetical protein
MAPEGKDARDPMDAIMAEVAQETGGTGHAYPRPGRAVRRVVLRDSHSDRGYRFEAAQVEDDGTLRITGLDRGPGSASCSVTRSRPTNGSTWSPRTGSAPCSGSSAGQDGDEVLAVLAAYHRRASGRLSGILQNPEVAAAFTNCRS